MGEEAGELSRERSSMCKGPVVKGHRDLPKPEGRQCDKEGKVGLLLGKWSLSVNPLLTPPPLHLGHLFFSSDLKSGKPSRSTWRQSGPLLNALLCLPSGP